MPAIAELEKTMEQAIQGKIKKLDFADNYQTPKWRGLQAAGYASQELDLGQKYNSGVVSSIYSEFKGMRLDEVIKGTNRQDSLRGWYSTNERSGRRWETGKAD